MVTGVTVDWLVRKLCCTQRDDVLSAFEATSIMTALNRRELMRMGGISLAGLSLSSLMEAEAMAAPISSDGSFGRAKNIIYLYLNGGPPQHETFSTRRMRSSSCERSDCRCRSRWGVIPSGSRPSIL